ncbi:ribonuclease T2 [Nostoc sp. CENA67]|uniref:Ribonuclease T2 n=1 Tax=Amazonocrinis nigriterrae CENA67 TaxID=2794033 RepID=A0A8J7LC53_9NOST|nr:ribonuclease T2 [Amazonocrinis nigriterrae]MBH8566395.1 ribonuclease T2 [Amazonocrinis nigriterrae CENA67]
MQKLKKCLLLAISLCFCLTLWYRPAYAFITLNDQFVAGQACEALESIRSKTNPGNIRLTPQKTYPVVGKNRDNASYYLLKVEGAQPLTRWVSVQCGQLLGSSAPVDQAYLLALSWQPSFCETKPTKPECQSQTAQRFDATNLVLHGLWPQPRTNIYCNVSNDIERLDKNNQWSQLPPINLSQETRNALAVKMPGFASNLHLHEWYKHGTCYSESPEEYFQEAIALLDQVNNSSVGDLFVRNIGNFLSANEIRNQFDEAFHDGAGSKVQVQCERDIDEDKNNMVVELQINLRGNIQPDTPIETLLQAGQTVPAGCTRGEIDPAGFN